jgi:DNA topoisomerase I
MLRRSPPRPVPRHQLLQLLPPERSAQCAGLNYVNEGQPGLRRIRSGTGFRYRKPRGGFVSDAATLARIKSLAIPPAWHDVWVCRDPQGHVQAVGRDDRGRKQYRYHPRWREFRDANKFNRLISFGQALPRIRRRVRRDLRRPGLAREKVLAAVVRLIELAALRIGNDEYADQNKSYGLTTLRRRHASVRGSRITFCFRGKSGVRQRVEVSHPILSRIVRRCQDLPGQDLFQYVDSEGKVQDVTSGDVNAYLRAITGQDFTAKDFRTWTATVEAARALRDLEPAGSKAASRKNLTQAIEQVAERLGNTPAICKKCYIHPAIFEVYLEGQLAEELRRASEAAAGRARNRLPPDEAAVVALLRKRLTLSEDDRLRAALRRSLRHSAHEPKPAARGNRGTPRAKGLG